MPIVRYAPLVLLAAISAGCSAVSHEDDCGSCTEAASATFHLACSPNNLTAVSATGPCSMPDASLAWYTGTATKWDVAVFSPRPGECHIELTFATGFVYSADVTFTRQTAGTCRGCPSYIGPISGGFTVDNPSDTCVAGGATPARPYCCLDPK